MGPGPREKWWEGLDQQICGVPCAPDKLLYVPLELVSLKSGDSNQDCPQAGGQIEGMC
jgi:hypothetical protein